MQVFVGGLGGGGKEVVMATLAKVGFNVGCPGSINSRFDSGILGAGYRDVLSGKSGSEELKHTVSRVVGKKDDRIALKCGMSMFIPKQLRDAFPDCKFVLCVRHPVNQISLTREYDSEVREHVGFNHLYRKATSEERAVFWVKSYQIAMKELPVHFGRDLLILKLEDMWLKTAETIQGLLDFVGSVEDAQSVSGHIAMPLDHDIGYRKLTDLERRQGNRCLTDHEKDRVVEITESMRLEFGYGLS
jgi:hypothetical protein